MNHYGPETPNTQRKEIDESSMLVKMVEHYGSQT